MAALTDQNAWVVTDPTPSGTQRAKRLARRKNRHEYTASLVVPGSVRWNAGVVVSLDGTFGPKFQGNYLITECTHTVSKETGYVTHLKMRKTLEAY